MKNLLSFEEFLNEGISISDLSIRDEQPMIKGIAEIINRVKGINRVVFDISSKPPATIEWE